MSRISHETMEFDERVLNSLRLLQEAAERPVLGILTGETDGGISLMASSAINESLAELIVKVLNMTVDAWVSLGQPTRRGP